MARNACCAPLPPAGPRRWAVTCTLAIAVARSSTTITLAVLEYLARYTHRVALSNDRLVSVSTEEVRLQYRDRARGHASKLLRLPPAEFLRRFLLHVLPARFKRLRHYGLTANRSKAIRLAACRAALNTPAPQPPVVESAEAFLIRLLGRDVRRCPHCQQGRLLIVQHLLRPTRLPDLRATGPPDSPC